MSVETTPPAPAGPSATAAPALRRASPAGLGPLPLVVGVTGHRDLRDEDVPRLEARVREMLRDLRAKYPHTPITVLSPLAEGADQLVAKVALELGLRLVVPLPMPLDLYVTDFEGPARAEFDRLLALADTSFPVPYVEGSTRESVRLPGPDRDRQYAMVGAFIARQSQLLFALWDGVHTDLTGGTSQVMRFELEGVPEPYAPRRSPLDPVESGPVYHVVTPRRQNPAPEGKPFALHKRYPTDTADGGQLESVIERVFQRLDTFNEDALALDHELAKNRRQSMDWLYPDDEFKRLDGLVDPSLAAIRECYAVADTMATHFRDRTTLTLRWLSALTFVVVTLFLVYDKLKPEGASEDPTPQIVIGLSVVALAAAYLGYVRANRRDLLNKYLSYRALAEGLRVQFFWRLADLSDTVSDHYLRKQRSELDWIRHAIAVWGARLAPPTREAAALTRLDRVRLVDKHWVNGQASYFTNRAFDADLLLARFQNVGYLLLLGAVLMSVVRIFLDAHDPTNPFELLVVLTSLVPAGVALWHGYDKVKKMSVKRKQPITEEPISAQERTHRLRGLRRLRRRFIQALAGITVLLALTVAVVFSPAAAEHRHSINTILVIGVGLLLAGAAVLQSYTERRAYSAHANQYGRMRVLYDNASRTLTRLIERGDEVAAEELLRDLGKEALVENGDWVTLHRERPLPSP